METLRILVVDDEPKMRAGIVRVLKDFVIELSDYPRSVRFELDQAASGEEALEKLGAQKFDLLLLDMKLPGIQGFDVLKHVTTAKLDVVVVMITAYASIEAAVSTTKQGAFDFLAKPFAPQDLKSTLEKAAGHLIIQRHARTLEHEKRQMRFQLISVVAHELKAPLGAIEGYLHLIKERPAGNEWATYDKAIDRSIVRLEGMRKLISDLLDMTRIESGQRKYEIKRFDLLELVRAAIDMLTPEARQRGIVIELHSADPLHIDADRQEIEIIVNNLLTNAVKYNRDNGRVDITIGKDKEKYVIGVSDTGIGLSPEERSRLFRDFVRIKNSKTRNILGSGLGLSISKKIAKLYGGDITVQSEPDKGSTFTVTFVKRDTHHPVPGQPDATAGKE